MHGYAARQKPSRRFVDLRQGAVEAMAVNAAFWGGKGALVTGHADFKGSWLVPWLIDRGAHLASCALRSLLKPSLFELARVQEPVSLLEWIVEWRRAYLKREDLRQVTALQIARYHSREL